MDYREYVGGNFDKIGLWQYNYIIENTGIKPTSNFLDIACGCLRLGVHLIPFLDKGKYYGIEGSEQVLAAGLNEELDQEVRKQKLPNTTVNLDFDFSFCDCYDIAWSNSLLSHLTTADIKKLFVNLRQCSNKQSKFYFTYFDKKLNSNITNPDSSHPNKDFYYSWEEIKQQLDNTGWTGTQASIQSHPRKQTIVCARIT